MEDFKIEEKLAEDKRVKAFSDHKFQEILSIIRKITSKPSKDLIQQLKKVLLTLEDINDWWDYENGSLLDNAVGNQTLVNLLMILGATRILKSEKLIQFIQEHGEKVRHYLEGSSQHREFCIDLGVGVTEFNGLWDTSGSFEMTDGMLNFIAKNWSVCPIDKMYINTCRCLTPEGIREFVRKTNIQCLIVSSDQLAALTLPEINLDINALVDTQTGELTKDSKEFEFAPCYKLPGCDTSICQIDLNLSIFSTSNADEKEWLDNQLNWFQGNKYLEAITVEVAAINYFLNLKSSLGDSNFPYHNTIYLEIYPDDKKKLRYVVLDPNQPNKIIESILDIDVGKSELTKEDLISLKRPVLLELSKRGHISLNNNYLNKFLRLILTLPNVKVVFINNDIGNDSFFLPEVNKLTRLKYLRFKADTSSTLALPKELSEVCRKTDDMLGYCYTKRHIYYRFSDTAADVEKIRNDGLSNIINLCIPGTGDSLDEERGSHGLSNSGEQVYRQDAIQLIHEYEAYMIFRLIHGQGVVSVNATNMQNHPLYVRDQGYWQKIADEKKSTRDNLRKDERGKFKRLQAGFNPDDTGFHETKINGLEDMIKAIGVCRRLVRQRLSDALDASQKSAEYKILYEHPIISRFRQTVEVLLRNCFLAGTLMEKIDQAELRSNINKVNPEYAFLLNYKVIVAFVNSITEGTKYDLFKKMALLAEKTARLLALDMQDVLVKKRWAFDVYSFAHVSVVTMMNYIVNASIDAEDTIKETAYNLMFAVIRGPKVKAYILDKEGESVGKELLRMLKDVALAQKKMQESQERMESKIDEINSKIGVQNQLMLRRFDELLSGVDEQVSKLSGEAREQAERVIRTQKEYFEKFVARQFKIDEELRVAIASLTQDVQKDIDFAKERFGRGRDNITAFKREFYLNFLDKMAKYTTIANGGAIPETAMRKAISTTGSIISEIPSMGIAGIVAKVGTQVALAVYDMHKRSQYKKKDLFIQRADGLSDFSLVIIDLAEVIAFIYFDQLQHIVSYDKEPDQIKLVADTAVKLIMMFCINHEIDKVLDGVMKKNKAIRPETVVNILLSGLIFQGQQVNFVGTRKVATIDELFEEHHLKIFGKEIKLKPDQGLDLLLKAYDVGSDKLKEKIDNAAAGDALDLIVPVFELLKGVINPDRRHWSIEGMFQRSLFLTFDAANTNKSLESWSRTIPQLHLLVKKEGTRCDKYGYCLLPLEVVEQHNIIVNSLKSNQQITTRLEKLKDGLAVVQAFHQDRVERRQQALTRLMQTKDPAFTLPELMNFDQNVQSRVVRYTEIYKDKAEIQVQQLTEEIVSGTGVSTKELLLTVLLRSLHYSIPHSTHGVQLDKGKRSCTIMFRTADDYNQSKIELSQLAGISIVRSDPEVKKQDRLKLTANFADNTSLRRNIKSVESYDITFGIVENNEGVIAILEEFCKVHQAVLIQSKQEAKKAQDDGKILNH